MCATTVGTETVMVDEIPFPPEITTTKPLSLLGHGTQQHVTLLQNFRQFN